MKGKQKSLDTDPLNPLFLLCILPAIQILVSGRLLHVAALVHTLATP